MNKSVKKILIVDDEPNIVKAIAFLLEDSEHEIYTAYNGEEGFELALLHKPDVILLDVMMPGRDGYSVAKKIRQLAALDHVKIVFLTAKGTVQDKMSGYDSGAEMYLVKPFDNIELVDKINALLEG